MVERHKYEEITNANSNNNKKQQQQ